MHLVTRYIVKSNSCVLPNIDLYTLQIHKSNTHVFAICQKMLIFSSPNVNGIDKFMIKSIMIIQCIWNLNHNSPSVLYVCMYWIQYNISYMSVICVQNSDTVWPQIRIRMNWNSSKTFFFLLFSFKYLNVTPYL